MFQKENGRKNTGRLAGSYLSLLGQREVTTTPVALVVVIVTYLLTNLLTTLGDKLW
jgi:hypothetical protein